MARRVEVQPAVAEDPRLEARRVGHGDDEHAAGREQPRRVADGRRRARAGARASARTRPPPTRRRSRRAARRGRRAGRRSRSSPSASRPAARAGRRAACRRRRRRRAPARAARSRPGGRPARRACGAAARRRATLKRGARRGPVPVAVGARRAPRSDGHGSVVAAPQAARSGCGRAGATAPASERAPRTRRSSRGHRAAPGDRQTAHEVERRFEPVVAQLEVLGPIAARARIVRAPEAPQHAGRRAAACARVRHGAAQPQRVEREQPVERARAPRRTAPCSAASRRARARSTSLEAARAQRAAARRRRTPRGGRGR